METYALHRQSLLVPVERRMRAVNRVGKNRAGAEEVGGRSAAVQVATSDLDLAP